MLDLRNDFRIKSKADLKTLSFKINATTENGLPQELVHEAFRKLHTIKGTAQTFGFVPAGKIAHALEDLLADGIADDPARKVLLLEGIKRLILSLDNDAQDESESFQDGINSKKGSSGAATIFVSKIPPDEFYRFAEHEKDRLIKAAADRQIASIETHFETADIAKQFAGFRERLAAECEVIASMPCHSAKGGKTAIRTYFAIDDISLGMKNLADEFSSNVALQTISPGSENALRDVMQGLWMHAADLGRQLGSDVRILLSTNELDPPSDKIGLLFDILLHLVRNAIDHSKSKMANITIRLEFALDSLKLEFSDDGFGIDLAKVRATATEKGLISPETAISDDEVMKMIFLPGFSTAKKITEVSGRGYGLDAVRKSVTDVNGTIYVATEQNERTTFEIYLPNPQ